MTYRNEADTRGAKVPTFAALILGFVCPPDRLEAVLGDLDQTFQRLAKECNIRAARKWYYWQVIRSVAAFGFGGLQKAAALYELFEKFRR